MGVAMLVLLAAESLLLSWYLPLVREDVEALGAYLSLVAVLLLCQQPDSQILGRR